MERIRKQPVGKPWQQEAATMAVHPSPNLSGYFLYTRGHPPIDSTSRSTQISIMQVHLRKTNREAEKTHLPNFHLRVLF